MSVVDDPDFERGTSLTLARDYGGAIAAFEIAAARHSDEPLALKELGLAYARRGEASLPDSLRQRDAGELSSEPSSLRASLGEVVQAALGLAVVGASKAIGQTDWIVRYREDFRTGASALERSIGLSDKSGSVDAEAYYVLAQCLRYLGDTDAARAAARRAVEIEPSDPAYAARARALDMLPESADPPASGTQQPKWADVVLPQRTKRELRQMQLMLEDPQLAASLGVEPPTGLLLYGPPGTGKTTIARVLASEAKCRFFATSPAEINSMWLGESEKQVKRLFDQARAAAPSIIFLDEIDALLPMRAGGMNMYSDKVVNQFLHEMDGLRGNRRVFVVGATNRRDMLDPALLRGGRLSREIEIPVPDADGRRALFEIFTRRANLAPEISVESLAEQSDGLSGASIRALVNEAGLQALIRLAEEPTADRHVTSEDFSEALANFRSQEPSPPDPTKSLWPNWQ